MNRQTYDRLGTVAIETVHTDQLHAWGLLATNNRPKIDYLGVSVKLFSKGMRLRTFFVHGTKCSACGLEASHYAVERPAHESGDFPYHLNLWGFDANGQEVLFTHDHTLARSAGGKDAISNTTTMCSPCNFTKSLVEPRGMN